MEEQTVDMALSQSRDRGGQETFKKREIVKFVTVKILKSQKIMKSLNP